MPDSLEVIAAQLRAADPVGYVFDASAPDSRREMTAQEYDAWIAEAAGNVLAHQVAVEAEADRIALRTLVRNYLTTLSDNEDLLLAGIANLKGATPPSTVAALRNYVTQMAEMTLDHNRGLDRLIRVLIDKGVVERDES